MSLPNGPADPYPEAFGWPWHGRICKPYGQTAYVQLPSGATHPIKNFASPDTHLFDAGMPAPTMPVVADQAWWNRGIRRGLDGLDVWSGLSYISGKPSGIFQGCVIAGVPYPHRLELSAEYAGGGYAGIIARVWRTLDGLTAVYASVSLAPAGFGLDATELKPGSGFQCELIVWGAQGDRALYKIMGEVIGRNAPLSLCAIVEARYDPVALTCALSVVADYAQCKGLKTLDQGSAEPTNYIRWPLRPTGYADLPASAPAPADHVESDGHTGFTLGTYEAQEELTAVVHAWYLPGDVVELVWLTLNGRLEWRFPSFGSYGTTTAYTLTLSGVHMYEVIETGDAEPVDDWTISVISSLTLNGESLSGFTFEGPRNSGTGLMTGAQHVGLAEVGRVYYFDAFYATGASAWVSLATMSNHCLGMSARAIVGPSTDDAFGNPIPAAGSSGWLEYGPVKYPAGSDPSRQRRANYHLMSEAARYGFGSASWNPVTGQLARGGNGVIYSWV
ncbi:MAG: hypothetical protein WA173_02070 [Pseudomonas sp.]|uniref:hypothetical protein n=1 Tax=Pseudomonas sp. TaxID=306 RepID=UPI003BB58162